MDSSKSNPTGYDAIGGTGSTAAGGIESTPIYSSGGSMDTKLGVRSCCHWSPVVRVWALPYRFFVSMVLCIVMLLWHSASFRVCIVLFSFQKVVMVVLVLVLALMFLVS